MEEGSSPLKRIRLNNDCVSVHQVFWNVNLLHKHVAHRKLLSLSNRANLSRINRRTYEAFGRLDEHLMGMRQLYKYEGYAFKVTYLVRQCSDECINWMWRQLRPNPYRMMFKNAGYECGNRFVIRKFIELAKTSEIPHRRIRYIICDLIHHKCDFAISIYHNVDNEWKITCEWSDTDKKHFWIASIKSDYTQGDVLFGNGDEEQRRRTALKYCLRNDLIIMFKKRFNRIGTREDQLADATWLRTRPFFDFVSRQARTALEECVDNV